METRSGGIIAGAFLLIAAFGQFGGSRSQCSEETISQLFEQALKRLPAEFRESLVLFELEGWSYKTIAAALDVPLGTVMSRLSRARRRLQRELTRSEDIAISDEH